MHRAWIAACLGLSGCALLTLASKQRSWPDQQDVVAADVAARVVVHRDAWGVPHIRADREADGWYALGWVHAQDRLFQIDVNRRLSWGELTPWLGEGAARYDLFVKAMDLRGRSEQVLREHATPDERARLVAYAEGVNDAVAAADALPVEYRLLDRPWEPWQPVDGLAVPWIMSWTLADNPGPELAALLLRDRVDAETLDGLFRYHPETPPVDPWWDDLRQEIDAGPLTPTFRAFLDALGGSPGEPEASNNWVVGPSRSADGLPIVANDPHLSQRVPSLWYTAEIRAGDVHVAGVTLPGAPGVVIGHNERVAWGLTNTMADVVDLAVLERVGDTGYLLAGEERAFGRRVVRTTTPDGETIEGEVLTTEVGPVITEPGEHEHVVALRWHALEVDDRSLAGFAALGRASSVDEGLEAVDQPMMVSQNLVLADVDGDFAWQVIGSVVRRRNHTGRVPYPASDPGYGWQGWLDRLPGERRPERGWVHTANNRPDHPLADAISTTFVPPHRYDRIATRLAELDQATPDDLRALQLDVYDQFAADVLPGWLEGVEPSTPAAGQCEALLEDWDYQATPEAVGAAVFAVLHRELLVEAMEGELTPADARLILRVQSSGRSLAMGPIERFLDDRAAAVDASLHRACTWLAAEYGDDPARWSWGALHPLRLTHPFGRSSKLLTRWNMPEIPAWGTGSTVAAAGYGLGGRDFSVTSMQSMRLVMPLGDLGASTLVQPGGQSGHPGHPDYADQFSRFVEGEPVPLWFDDDDVAEHAVRTLFLRPR